MEHEHYAKTWIGKTATNFDQVNYNKISMSERQDEI